MTSPSPKLRVGVIGAGEVAQVIHLPTLTLLNHLYAVVSIADVSRQTVEHVAAKFNIPHKTTNPSELISRSDVDVVFILASDEFHETLCIAALKAGKKVFIEKPVSLSIASVERIIAAEKAAGGEHVFVGYMRRYAPSFTEAFKREIAAIPRILHARVRDIVGPNPHFVAQSGTSPVRHTDFPAAASRESSLKLEALLAEAFPDRRVQPFNHTVGWQEYLSDSEFFAFLPLYYDRGLLRVNEAYQNVEFEGGIDNFVIPSREAIGFPESVAGVSANEPFYSALFNYKNKTGEPYAVIYESGIDGVPRFDANLAVYGEKKTVSIQYNTPYVKGLPIFVKVDELNDRGEATTREVLTSFEDAYTVELKEMHACFVDSKPIKTSTQDALYDLRIFDMMYRKYIDQNGGA